MPNDAAMTSPWSGMSGAAVFAGEQLVGVITYSIPRRGAGELVVYPMSDLAVRMVLQTLQSGGTVLV